MNLPRFVGFGLVLFLIVTVEGAALDKSTSEGVNVAVAHQQVLTWSTDDYLFDTAGSGNSNSGHDYGTKLSEDEKHDLVEYLKTL